MPKINEYKPNFPSDDSKRYELLNGAGSFVHMKDGQVVNWIKSEKLASELIKPLSDIDVKKAI